MKNLVMISAALVLFAGVSFGQDNTQKQNTGQKVETKKATVHKKMTNKKAANKQNQKGPSPQPAAKQ